MGRGIAQVAAQSGYTTILYDVNETILRQARVSVEKGLQTLVERQRMSVAEKKQAEAAITYTGDLAICRADLTIEAIAELIEAKTELFRQLEALNPPESLFASNTSSLSVTAIAASLIHPDRMMGMHFFNPAPIMKLVELVTTASTSDYTVEQLAAVAKKMGKTAVLCKDSPGFIVNRVARPFYIESLRLAEEGIATYEKMDHLLESVGFKMGPFRLMDLIGNDINFKVSCSVYEQLGKPPRLRPSHLQEEKVKNGALGKKTGEGYYHYD
jgi:3-hydroxybutyryl-CoA dehydrogenase